MRQQMLAKFTALSAIIGIAVGVGGMLFAISLANGFQAAMQDKILQNSAHIAVFRADGADIAEWQNLSNEIKSIAGVKSVSAASFDNALIIGRTNSAFAVLRGLEVPSSKFQVPSPESEFQIPNSKIKRPIIEIGKNLAEKTGLQIGDAATIVSGNGEIGENFTPTSTLVEVSSIFSTGLYEYDSTWIRVSLADAAILTDRNSVTANALNVETDDIYQSNNTSRKIIQTLGPDFKVLDWQEANRPLFAALSLERRVAMLIIALIVFIAVVNITTTLILIVNERCADIAIFKTCGATSKVIVLIFLMQGAILGMSGIVGGIFLGMAACWICNYFGLLSLPAEVYSISHIVLQPQVSEIFLTAAGAFVLSLAASAFPALAAARIRPIEGFK